MAAATSASTCAGTRTSQATALAPGSDAATFCAALGVDVRHDDLRALGGVGARDGLAEPAPGAGDDGDLVLKQQLRAHSNPADRPPSRM